MQSSRLAGESSRPSRRCRIRGNPETHGRQTGMRDSGQPEDPSPAPLGERRFGATRRFTDGTAGRCGIQGNLENHQPGPEDAGIGATRSLCRRGRRRVRDSGQPEDPPAGAAEGAKSRGNPGIHQRHSRRVQDSGQPEDCIGKRCNRSGDSGQPGDSPPAAWIGCEIRGNSKIHRRPVGRCGMRGNP
jgi:hypothetical protein